ncbi:MAG: hypothetical protein ACLPM3_09805 [Terracidiphilus sp.]
MYGVEENLGIGLFHNVVDQPATFIDTNLAQMLTFAIDEGIAAGWLPASYQPHADQMRAAALLKMGAAGTKLASAS